MTPIEFSKANPESAYLDEEIKLKDRYFQIIDVRTQELIRSTARRTLGSYVFLFLGNQLVESQLNIQQNIMVLLVVLILYDLVTLGTSLYRFKQLEIRCDKVITKLEAFEVNFLLLFHSLLAILLISQP